MNLLTGTVIEIWLQLAIKTTHLLSTVSCKALKLYTDAVNIATMSVRSNLTISTPKSKSRLLHKKRKMPKLLRLRSRQILVLKNLELRNKRLVS